MTTPAVLPGLSKVRRHDCILPLAHWPVFPVVASVTVVLGVPAADASESAQTGHASQERIRGGLMILGRKPE